ncbi:MAG: hypothetical protein V1929_09760 [bacterium]
MAGRQVAATGAVRASANKYVSGALTRSRTSISALAQKPRILEQALVQGRADAQVEETESRLTMPLLGKIWKEMAAHLA